jgi:hypothetical protein
MIETLYGLARLGYTNAKGMPPPLQLALVGREFSDVVVFRSPPRVVQRAVFGALASIGLAWLPCDLPTAFTHGAGSAGVTEPTGNRRVMSNESPTDSRDLRRRSSITTAGPLL